MNCVLRTMESQQVIPVVRANTTDDAKTIVEAIIMGGMRMVELTTTIPGVYELVGVLRKSHPHAVFALGTIRDRDGAERAINSGAELLISYKVSEEIAEVGQRGRVPYILGGVTPTEIDRCVELGSAMVKLFPASILGPGIVHDLQGPFPGIKYFPTGSITLEEIDAWLDSGASAVGIGGALLRGSPREIRDNVRTVMANLLRRAKERHE